GSPHAQPGQSNPSGWFAFSIVRAPEIGIPLCSNCLPQLFKAPQPPAAADFFPMNFVPMLPVYCRSQANIKAIQAMV
ncbi:hypothetical protein ACE04B_20530, partial [Rhizobium phaseoli]